MAFSPISFRSDIAMDKSYTILVGNQFENPRIKVSTFHYSLYIQDYAVHLGIGY